MVKVETFLEDCWRRVLTGKSGRFHDEHVCAIKKISHDIIVLSALQESIAIKNAQTEILSQLQWAHA